MAYCRAGWDGSDVYCYADVSGGYTVWLPGPSLHTFPAAQECADFLELKRAEGLEVPQYAIDELREDAKEEALSFTSEEEAT